MVSRSRVILCLLVLLVVTSCAGTAPVAEHTQSAAPPGTPADRSEDGLFAARTVPVLCPPPAIVVPTAPAQIPNYGGLDRETGLHVTGDVQEIDLENYRLEVTGEVDHPLALSYDEIRCIPRIEARPELICPGLFVDISTWAGASLDRVLEMAGVKEGASEIELISADGYSTTVLLSELGSGSSFLAYEWEGEPLSVLHGFPIRAVFPGLAGGKWVKWLVEIKN